MVAGAHGGGLGPQGGGIGAEVVPAAAHGQGRDARLDEAVVVGAEVAPSGVRVGPCHSQPLGLGQDASRLPQGAALAKGQADVPGGRDPVEAVQVEVRRGRGQGPEGCRGVGPRAQQALLLGTDEQEHLAALGGPGHGGSGHGQKGRAARGVVHGAVVDRVGLVARVGVRGGGEALAQVIPVGGIDHQLLLQLGIRAGHHTRHIELLHGPHGADQGALQGQAQGHGAEVAALGLNPEGIQVLATALDQGPGRLLGQPALKGRALGLLGQPEALTVPAVPDHGPAITGRGGGVDEQHPGGTVPGGHLELGGPAAVDAEVGAVEEAGFLRCRGRFVHQQQQHLAAHIQALEVVPEVLGRLDAEAQEDHGRIKGLLGLRHPGAEDELGAEGRAGAGAFAHEAEGAAADEGPQPEQAHRLAVGLAPPRGGTQGLKLGLQVADRELGPPLPRAPALEQVIGEEGQVGPQGGLLHLRWRGLGDEAGRDQKGQQGMHGNSGSVPMLPRKTWLGLVGQFRTTRRSTKGTKAGCLP